MMFLIIVIPLIIILVAIVSYMVFLVKCMWPVRHLPGPLPLPLIGCAYLFPNVKAMLNGFFTLTNNYGPVCKMMVGIEPSILLSDYKLIEQTLRSSKLIEKSKSYRHFHNWLGLGLLTSGGQKWRQRRKLLTPSYHFQILERFLPVFDRIGNVLLEKLQERIRTHRDIDVYPLVTLCTLDIICETAMGTSVNALINQNSDYVQAVKGMCNVIMEKVFSPLQHYQTTFKFTRNYQREKRFLRILNEFTMDVIQQRKEKLHQSEQDGHNEGIDDNARYAFLDLLLQQGLSDEDIREEVSTFMFEGHDTTASALSFCLLNIAHHPEVQQKLIDEQQEIFGDDKSSMATFANLNEMKYMELVIKETLRLYPSVPFFARETQEDIQLDELTIPKHFTIIIFAMAIQRDERFFPSADKFNPERFSTGNGSFPYSFIPFSAGHRNCIGQKFAMLEMKAVLSKIIRNFVLTRCSVPHKVELVCETILKSTNGVKLNMRPR